jgi:glucoamylase
MFVESLAPGWPGIPARWTSSAKTGVGTALSARSRVWFTLSHGTERVNDFETAGV